MRTGPSQGSKPKQPSKTFLDSEEETKKTAIQVQKAEIESQRAEIEFQRAEWEARRSERLAAKLRELNIDPETI